MATRRLHRMPRRPQNHKDPTKHDFSYPPCIGVYEIFWALLLQLPGLEAAGDEFGHVWKVGPTCFRKKACPAGDRRKL